MNCCIPKQKIDLKIKSKNPLYSERTIFLQIEKEKKSITERIKTFRNKDLSPRNVTSHKPPTINSPNSRSLFHIKKKKEEIANRKKVFIENLVKTLTSCINYKYMNIFFIILSLSKQYWLGRKITNTMKNLLKDHLQSFFDELHAKSLTNSISIFKIFLSKVERSLTYETSINYSPRSKLQLEVTTRGTDLSKSPIFENSHNQLSKVNCNSSSYLDSDSSAIESQSSENLIMNKTQKKYNNDIKLKNIFNNPLDRPQNQQIDQLLERNFDNIRKLIRSKQNYSKNIMKNDSSSPIQQNSKKKIETKQNDSKNTMKNDSSSPIQQNSKKKIKRLIRLIKKNQDFAKKLIIKKWKIMNTKIKRIELIKGSLKRLEKKSKIWILIKKSLVLRQIFLSFNKSKTQTLLLIKITRILKSQMHLSFMKIIAFSKCFTILQNAFTKICKLQLYLNFIKIVNLTKCSKILQSAFTKIKKYQKFIKKNNFLKFKEEIKSKNKKIARNKENYRFAISRIIYVIKFHTSVSTLLSWELIKSYTEKVKHKVLQNKSSKLSSLCIILSSKILIRKRLLLKSFKKYYNEVLFFEKYNQIASSHRKKHIISKAFEWWERLKIRNKMLCRGFELLGRFVNLKKRELLKIIKIPFTLEYYRSDKYNILSKLALLLYKKKKFYYIRLFSRWKISKVIGVKLLQLISIFRKHISLNLLTSWEKITERAQIN